MADETFDFRLVAVEVELGILQYQLDNLEDQITRSKDTAEEEWTEIPDEDWADREQRSREYEYEIGVILPRTWRNPFLVTMSSVYEAAVEEVSALVRKRQGSQIGLNDLRGEFLDRAKKYCKDVLQFELSLNNERWKRLKILFELRNIVAHSNGRLEMTPKATRKRVLKHDGVGEVYGYLIVERDFLGETFALVRDELEDLVARYREWDEANRKRQ